MGALSTASKPRLLLSLDCCNIRQGTLLCLVTNDDMKSLCYLTPLSHPHVCCLMTSMSHYDHPSIWDAIMVLLSFTCLVPPPRLLSHDLHESFRPPICLRCNHGATIVYLLCLTHTSLFIDLYESFPPPICLRYVMMSCPHFQSVFILAADSYWMIKSISIRLTIQ